MNTLKTSLYLIFVVAFSGCATQARVVVTQPVGPARPHVARRKNEGELVVYSALEVVDAVQSDFPTHTGYKIFDDNGKFLRRVDNRTGSFYQDPVTVTLPPGKYKVKAEATNAGEVTVPVVIEEAKTTVVDLDGATLPQHKPTGEGEWVRLPGGTVIGAKAE